MKIFGQLLVLKCILFLLVIFNIVVIEGGKRQGDPRWLTGYLPKHEIRRIKESLKDIVYLLFDRSKNDWKPLHQNDPIPESIWNADGDIKLIIHGYTLKRLKPVYEQLADQNILSLGSVYATQNSSLNVLIVDWTVLSTESLYRYYEASEATRYVGEEVARFLIRLANESLLTDWDRVHLIGFSLGGHTVGVVGAKVQELAEVKIGRITGLDPAGPNFEDEGKLPDNLARVLDKTDAKFVDIIHCNMRSPGKTLLGHLGSCVPAGHVDFFPDGGEEQQQFCTRRDDSGTKACSHVMCPWFMKESITNPRIACPCKNWSDFKNGECNCTLETNGVLMGDPCPETATGQYFLQIKK